MNKPIYLDYNATTPLHTQVLDTMLPYLQEHFGNPSSSHPYGLVTKQAVENAREQVASLLNCSAQEIVFTSGGTESNNTALRGVAATRWERGNHLITSAIEHPAVTEVCRWLGTQGFEITTLPVDGYGLVNPADLQAAMRASTILVSIMHANNEVGTLQPIQELAAIAHQHGALFHTDAAQSVGKLKVDVQELGVDLLSVAGHKLYAPKGVGVLYIREGIEIPNLMFGAGHESGRRPGTENVASIVGLGAACWLARQDLESLGTKLRNQRDRLQQGLLNGLGAENVQLNGHPEKRLPNTLNLSFRGVAANQLLAAIQEQVAASAGSACHADRVQTSEVLLAMGIPQDWAMGAVRFSVGRYTTPEEIERAVDVILAAVQGSQKTSFLMK
jgi:cysteine desulfurase